MKCTCTLVGKVCFILRYRISTQLKWNDKKFKVFVQIFFLIIIYDANLSADFCVNVKSYHSFIDILVVWNLDKNSVKSIQKFAMYPMHPINTNQGGGFIVPNQCQQLPYPAGSDRGDFKLPKQSQQPPYPASVASPYPGGLSSSGYGTSYPTPSSLYPGSQTTSGSSAGQMINFPVKQGDHRKPYPGSYGAYPGTQSNYKEFSKGEGLTSWPGGESYPDAPSVAGVPKTSFNPCGMSTLVHSSPLYPNLGTAPGSGQPGIVKQEYGIFSQQSSYPDGRDLPYPVKPPGHS